MFIFAGDPAAGIVSLLCCGSVLGIPFLLWWNSYKQAELRRQRIVQAENAYRNALEHLKRKPNDPNLKQTALNLGRNYSAMCRESKVTVYDEMALMNDINAATAGATQQQYQPPPMMPQYQPQAPTGQLSTEDRLAKLTDLKNKGLIDENEYQQRRQKLLDDI